MRSVNAPPQFAIDQALAAAARSPCAKSKRGACAFYHQEALAVGFNGPPGSIACDSSWACRTDCGKRCIHAEVRAVRGFANMPARVAALIDLVHVKIEDGKLVPGGGPSCWQCSREILDVGLKGVWLFEAQRWHDEVPCGTCNRKTTIAQGAGTTGVCEHCKAEERYPGLLELGRSKTIYAPDSGEWRYYDAATFHRVTLDACGIGGPRG